MNIDDAPRLRELCEKASKEFDHDKLLDLVRQINDLLERNKGIPGDDLGRKASAIAAVLARCELLNCMSHACVPAAAA